MAESYRARMQSRRVLRIARAQRNLSARRVSLAPAAEVPARSHANIALALSLSAAAVCHVGVAYAAFNAKVVERRLPKPTRVEVRVVQAPLPVEEVKPQEAPEIVPEVKRPEPSVPREKPKAKPVEAARPVEAPAPQPVAIVGLTLESTSSSGTGAAFAVGGTLAGSTDRTARAPVAAEPSMLPAAPEGVQPSRNRRVAPRAAEGVKVEPAKRLARVQPKYPALLERQGIEADVTVRVSLGADGRVVSVELVTGAGDRAFDEAALEAARMEHFSPETHDGKPVETAITYTYRFRITP